MRNRLLSALLVLLLCLLPACSPQQTSTDETGAVTTVEPAAQTFLLDARYLVIRGDTADESIEAAQYVRAAIEAMCGQAPALSTDWVKRGAEVIPGEYEILVGATNRAESAELAASLRSRDWAYRIEREGQILVCGGDGASTLEAAKAFCADVLGYTGEAGASTTSAAVEVTVGMQASYTHTYPVTSVTLDGVPIQAYTLVLLQSDTAFVKAANLFNTLLEERSGIKLPVEKASQTDAERRISISTQTTIPSAHWYTISADGDNLVFACQATLISTVIEEYFNEVMAEKTGEISLSLPEEPINGYTFGNELNGLVLSGERGEKIAEGVTWTCRNYTDQNGAPVVAHVMTIEPEAAAIIQGTPGGEYELYNVKATVPQAARAAENQGYTVLGAVNGDFFSISSDYHPRGLTIKNGIVMREVTTYPFFGITKDGEPLCGSGSMGVERKNDLAEAVGASHVLLVDGYVNDVGYGTDFGYTRHPRTAAGYDGEGRIFLLVVDGRQPSFSNGASLSDLAQIFLELGATNAVNLDGGGSSTFVTRDGSNLLVRNSPSDGAPRAVYNSLIVVAN